MTAALGRAIAFMRYSLLALSFAGLLACTVAWFFLMDRIVTAPRKPTAEQTVPINRHGETVYITPSDAELRYWLPVAGTILGPSFFLLALWARYAWAKEMAAQTK